MGNTQNVWANATEDQNWLDRLVGEEGIKTDIQVQIDNQSIAKIGGMLILTAVVITVLVAGVKKIL